MPSIWLSSIGKDQAAVQKIMTQMKTYGVIVKGHFWNYDNAKMAWKESLAEACAKDIVAWAIFATRDELNDEGVRYGLSMLALCLAAERGADFPILVLQRFGDALTAETLPTPLRQAAIIPTEAAGTQAKIVARLHAKAVAPPAPYFINMVGSAMVGQWLEIRPTSEKWPGIIFGVDQGEIAFQAVGLAGALPDKSTLHHAMRGLQIELGAKKYTAWAVRNEITPQSSYYVKIDGAPDSILFGPFTEGDQAEMFTLDLK
jgi:hypothetical protein